MVVNFIKASLLLVGMVFGSQVLAAHQIQHWLTEHGARVYFSEDKSLPMVDLRIVFDAGSARDNGKPGMALLTNGMLSEGAAGKNAKQLAEQFEAVGAQFSNGSLKDMAWLDLRSLSEARYLQPALNNLKDILSRPMFPEAAYKRELSRLKVALKASQQSPSTIADEAFYKALYGDHPYALPSNGTEASLKAMTLTDLKQFYRQYYVAKNAVVSIVGNVSREQAAAMVNELFAELPAGEKAEALPEVQPLTEAKTIRIDFPSKQSHVRVGQLGTRRGDRDYFTLYVANHPFGGSGFASRLVEEIREKRGLAYSVYSYFLPMRLAGPFQMGLQTRNDQTQQALDIIREELRRYVDQGPTPKELEDSVKNITGGFPLRVDSNRKRVEYLSMIGFYNLPLDYLDSFIGNIEAVDQNKIKDALKRRLDPDTLVTVIVGGAPES